MMLIADSGSTKTDWACINTHQISRHITAGLNVYAASKENWRDSLSTIAEKCNPPDKVYFYGAGCSGEKAKKLVTDHFRDVFPAAVVDINSDLLGAARSVLRNEKGVAAILGTGSALGVYDGNKLSSKVASLGFIADDLGSGVDIGKRLLRAYYKKSMPKPMRSEFEKMIPSDLEGTLDRIYRTSEVRQFLSSLVQAFPSDDPWLLNLVKSSFTDFFRENVISLPEKPEVAGFAGSIAAAFSEILREVAKDFQIKITRIYARPIEGLIEYHMSNG